VNISGIGRFEWKCFAELTKRGQAWESKQNQTVVVTKPEHIGSCNIGLALRKPAHIRQHATG
jgi:hypothetical protein